MDRLDPDLRRQVAVFLATQSELWVDIALILPVILIWWRRLHDVNLSGKWALLPIGVAFVIGFINGWNRAAREHAASDVTLTSLPANWVDLARQNPDAFMEGFWRGFADSVASQFTADPFTTTMSWAMTLGLAFWPGTAGPNRYGPAPGTITA